jgi:hypothetical protein
MGTLHRNLIALRGNRSPVKHPRSRIIRDKTDRHVVRRAATNGHDIAPDRIHEIRRIAPHNPDNIEVVLTNSSVRDKRKAEWTTYAVQMYRMLKTHPESARIDASQTRHLRGHRERGKDLGSLFL